MPAARRFRPSFWMTLCSLAALAVLVGLGVWQVQRLHWKEALIETRTARLGQAAIALPAAFEDPAALEFTRVALAGQFRHDRELYLGARTRKGKVGVHVVTPLVLADGRSLLVDRGWVPLARQDPATRPTGQLAGPVTLEAILRSSGWKGWGITRPENDPDRNLWLWTDLPAMAAAAGLDDPITAVYAQAVDTAPPGGLPMAVEAAINLRNDHLQYALTWFALAVALLVIYLIYSYQREE